MGDIPIRARGRLIENFDDEALLDVLDARICELFLARRAIVKALDPYAVDLSHGWPSVMYTPCRVLSLNGAYMFLLNSLQTFVLIWDNAE